MLRIADARDLPLFVHGQLSLRKHEGDVKIGNLKM